MMQELDDVVKTENITEDEAFLCTREIIKTNECLSKDSACVNCESKQTEIDSIKNAKKKLIADLTAAKDESQIYYSNWQKSERSLAEAQNQLFVSNSLSADQKIVFENQILAINEEKNNVIQENVELKSKLKGMKLLKKDVFEVKSIIGHRKKYGKVEYLVRWKGFDESHDSWSQEDNLFCPLILKRYKKTNNLL